MIVCFSVLCVFLCGVVGFCLFVFDLVVLGKFNIVGCFY